MSYEYLDERIISLSSNQREALYSMFKQQNNLETWAWPTYYVLAGIWCRAGEIIGLSGRNLLYWIRFLNIPISAAFVWISWLFSRKIFNNSFQMRIAIPLLTAFFPQDIFFAITADVLSPLVFAGAFFMLLEIALKKKRFDTTLLPACLSLLRS